MTPIRLSLRAVGPLCAVMAGLGWSIFYVWSVKSNPWHDSSALALIEPLVWILVPIGLYVVAEAVLGALKGELDETLGLDDWRRKSYLAVLAVLLVALPWLGFLGAGLPVLIGLAWWLGFRQPVVLALVAVAVALFFIFGLNMGLDIDLPLWPRFSHD